MPLAVVGLAGFPFVELRLCRPGKTATGWPNWSDTALCTFAMRSCQPTVHYFLRCVGCRRLLCNTVFVAACAGCYCIPCCGPRTIAALVLKLEEYVLLPFLERGSHGSWPAVPRSSTSKDIVSLYLGTTPACVHAFRVPTLPYPTLPCTVASRMEPRRMQPSSLPTTTGRGGVGWSDNMYSRATLRVAFGALRWNW